MATQSRAAPLPPDRAWWVKAMPPHRRLTHLLVEELERLQATRESGEAIEIRSFLKRFRAVTAEGNAVGVELGVGVTKLNMAVVYAHIPGARALAWFPALVMPRSDRIDRIRAEADPVLRFHSQPEPERDAWGRVEPKRPPVLAKVEIRMVGH